MSNWPGKYVIGLTGNIATGKSVVRRMLEHLGAYGIDADALAHRAIERGAPGYQPTVNAFGRYILDAHGEIERSKLGRVVFSDPEALEELEKIVHPLVEEAVDVLIRRSSQRVIVIEAIKILEGNLARKCDAIWVTTASQETQKNRLTKKRGMSEADANQRILAQGSQWDKAAAAKVMIENGGSFEETWYQVAAVWKKITTAADSLPAPSKAAAGEMVVLHGRPRDCAEIAGMINRIQPGAHPLESADIMAAFGEKAFLLLKNGDQVIGLAAWQVENLVARITEVLLDPDVAIQKALMILITEVERASRDLQSEAALLFLPKAVAQQEALWKELGYEKRSPDSLGSQAWQDAARESMPENTILFFKQLRMDRVLRPI